ncbi:helix-turn-helix transcriptional regulator [Cytobacillus suaedae]|nr:helix-turn-helix transcriptional regulator [Cytobacillus suaedae]
MLQEIGQRIRLLRTHKGISLNAFAEKLGVSPGYLSNLETGKTDTIQFSVLERIQDELSLLPSVPESAESPFGTRCRVSFDQLLQLNRTDERLAEFLLSQLEDGIQYWSK